MNVATIVTCMGRLQHLQQSFPTVVAQNPGRYVLVDYSCPDRCGAWAQQAWPSHAPSEKLEVVSVPGQRDFHKTRALNLGARRALELGAEWLCFVDADTLLEAGFWAWLTTALAGPPAFYIAGRAETKWEPDALVGTLVVHRGDFQQVQGYDERYRCWGAEDLDMRVRLRLVAAREVQRIPLHFLRSIDHTDDLRTLHYPEKDIRHSQARNRLLLRDTLRRLRAAHGEPPADLKELLRDLEDEPQAVVPRTAAQAGPARMRSRWSRQR